MTTPYDPPAKGDSENGGGDTTSTAGVSSPRAFVGGTGLVLEIVGMLFLLVAGMYLLGAGCFWSYARPAIDELARGVGGEPAPAPQALAPGNLVVLTSLVGGLALGVCGMGLRHEHPLSGRFAAATTLLMTLVFWGVCVALIIRENSWGQAILVAVPAILTTILFAFSIYSARILTRFPPPADRNDVTEEWLEAHEQARRARRS